MDSEEIYKQAILFRRWLHRHPEVSTQEFQTQAFVIDVLKEYKIPYKTYGTGIIATLGEGADCVALRLTWMRCGYRKIPDYLIVRRLPG